MSTRKRSRGKALPGWLSGVIIAVVVIIIGVIIFALTKNPLNLKPSQSESYLAFKSKTFRENLANPNRIQRDSARAALQKKYPRLYGNRNPSPELQAEYPEIFGGTAGQQPAEDE